MPSASRLAGAWSQAAAVANGATGDIFVDVTVASGLEFIHYNGRTGDHLLPEVTGSGGALFDYDRDGDLDLYAVQGSVLKETGAAGAWHWTGGDPPRDRLFRNRFIEDGTLTFEDVTASSGINALGYGMGTATGDVDNDGWVDLYVTNLGPNTLLRSNGDGTFSDVTAAAGVGDAGWSTSATFFDYDRDGWLDLFVTNYVDFSVDDSPVCYASSSAPEFCGPDAYPPARDSLFHNLGDGTFENVTARAGLAEAFGAGLGVVAADLNGDGWADLYVANDGDPNQLWLNHQGEGRFVDDALLGGVAFNLMGQAEAGMGIALGDIDADGDEDLFVTHLDGESNTLYMNQGDGLFEDRTIDAGLQRPSLPQTGFGTRFFDYDNDGQLDLVVLNGAVRQQDGRSGLDPEYPLQQMNQLFRGVGGRFEEVTVEGGAAFETVEVSRGASAGDLDNDGDVDLVVFNNSGPARVLMNVEGQRRHWLGLTLNNQAGGPAVGARISVSTGGGPSTWRRVHTDGSYCAASDPRVLVGLGDAPDPVDVRVEWPDGAVERHAGLVVDRYWTLAPGEVPR